jgi:hypothetical protein
MKAPITPSSASNSGCIPKIRISTPEDAVFADLVISDNGAYWRSAKENSYLLLPWKTLETLFESEGMLKAAGIVLES